MDKISTNDTLRRRAEIVRDETQDLANTAERVGQLLVDMIEGGSNVEIIESTEPVDKATEKNVFSALASLVHFLRKDAPDTAAELLKFLKGAEFGEFASGMLTGKGGKIWPNGHAELMSLLLRGWLEVPEIRYNRVQVVGGELWVTDGAKFDTVTPNGGLYNVKIKLEEGELITFWVGDILKGVYHDKSIDGKFKGFRTLQFRVTSVDQSTQTITVAPRYSEDKYKPVQFLEVARTGSFTEESRQRSILIDSKENCITFLDHVNTWDITPNMEVCWLGRKDRNIPGVPSTAGYNAKLSNIIMSGKIFQYDDISGNDYLVPIDKGPYVKDQRYAYYDRVSAPGGLWLCVNEAGTTSEPVDGNPDWLLQVSDGTSLTPAGNWNSGTTYSKGQIVYLNGDSFVYISATPSSGVRPVRNPGGYMTSGGKYLTTGGKRLYTGDPNHPWQLLAEAGKDGFSVVVQYSADKINWHDVFNPESDKYMRQLQQDGKWTDAMQIVGETGKDGPWTDFQFAVNGSLTDPPTSNWQDAPPTVGTGQYLWMRSGTVTPPATEPVSWSAARIGGAGIRYITDSYSPNTEYKIGDVVPFNGGKIYCKKDNTGMTPVPFLSSGGKLLKTGNFYLLYKPLSVGTINSEYWDIFVAPTVKEEVEQTFTAYFVGTPNMTPPTPILTGNSLGWSTTVPAKFNWVSQKRAISIAAGSWSQPVKMTAIDGDDGLNATTRWLTSTTSVIRFNSLGSPVPSSFVISCKKQTGILPVEACTDLYLVYRVYADATYVSQSTPAKTSSVTIANLRTDGIYYIRGYEKQSDAQAWNGNFTTEFTVTHVQDGDNGVKGAAGSMPRPRGKFISGQTYIWNETWRDIVFHSIGGVNTSFQVRNYGASVTAVPTSANGDDNWESAQMFSFVATDTLLVDGAVIADFIFKNRILQSSLQDNGKSVLSLDGNKGIISLQKGGVSIRLNPTGDVAVMELLYNGVKKLEIAYDKTTTATGATTISPCIKMYDGADTVEYSPRGIYFGNGGFSLFSHYNSAQIMAKLPSSGTPTLPGSGMLYKDSNGFVKSW